MKNVLLNRIIFIFVVLVVMSAIFSFPVYLIYSISKTRFVADLGIQGSQIAITISQFIEDDLESYKELNSVEDYDSDYYDVVYYEKMLNLFSQIKEQTQSTFVYTVKRVSESEYVYLLDGEDPSSESFSPIGSDCVIYDELYQAFNEKMVTHSSVLYDEEFDAYLVCANAPIIDPFSNQVVGVVGVDYSYDMIKPMLKETLILIITVAGLIIIIFTIIFYNIMESRNHAIGTDYLTGLFSRRYFDNHLRYNIIDAHVRKQPLSVMMIDIDDFKAINDTLGHRTGDQVLKKVADSLKTSIRRSDICARSGGDEFLIILPDATVDESIRVAQHISESIVTLSVMDEEQRIIPIVLSIGISEWHEGMTREELVDQADKAMYSIKKSKKEKIGYFKDNSYERVKRKE